MRNPDGLHAAYDTIASKLSPVTGWCIDPEVLYRHIGSA